MDRIPQFLIEMLEQQYGQELTNEILEGYTVKRKVTFRVNTLKTTCEQVEKVLNKVGIKFKKITWSDNAYIVNNARENELQELDIYKNGEIYLQSLSSMLPPIILEPKEGFDILDMAAAPGGKTTQISAETDDKAFITACEKNKIRSERLKYNIEKQGARKITVLTQDARDLDNYFSFDKILLDAPCSGSGTINLNNEKLEKTFTKELVERSVKTQIELLKKAITVLKPGHEMIYSTCSILKEENEENLSKIFKSGKVELVPINTENFKDITLLPVTIPGTLCVCPNELYEGFFIAKIRKK